MRRAIARGRVFPQSYSTDRRYGRLSLKAGFLYPMMWANGDDQGRLSGHPEEVKYAVCPSIDHITKADIPELLAELERNGLIKVYTTDLGVAVIQMLDWWNIHRPQWAWPSEYPSLDGWKDHLRYKKDAKTVVTVNWFSGEAPDGSQVSTTAPSGELSGEGQRHHSTRTLPSPQTPYPSTEIIKRKEERGNTPENAERPQVSTIAATKETKPHTHPPVLTDEDHQILKQWRKIDDWVLSDEVALQLIRQYREEFPTLDLLRESKVWVAAWLGGAREKIPGAAIYHWLERAMKNNTGTRNKGKSQGGGDDHTWPRHA